MQTTMKLVTAAATVLLLYGTAARADTPAGLWDAGESHIEVYQCGELLCGRIVELDEPLDADGNPKVDSKNPDPTLKGRPLLGIDLVANFSRKNDKRWVGGTIYDPRDGKTYKCKMNLKKNGTLEVRGYVGVSLFGKSVLWTRIE